MIDDVPLVGCPCCSHTFGLAAGQCIVELFCHDNSVSEALVERPVLQLT